MAVSNISPDPTRDRFVGVVKTAVTVADGQTVKEEDIPFNGLIKQIVFNVPALTGATSELLLHNEDTDELYASGERAESIKHTLTVDRAFAGILTLKVETNSAQSGSAAVHTATIYYI